MATTKDTDDGGALTSETPHRSSSATPRPAAGAAEPALERDSADRKTVSCNVPFCPICTVLSTAQHLQPEILGHLLTAAREISMAVRAVVDQRGDEVAPRQQQGLQHIDLA